MKVRFDGYQFPYFGQVPFARQPLARFRIEEDRATGFQVLVDFLIRPVRRASGRRSNPHSPNPVPRQYCIATVARPQSQLKDSDGHTHLEAVQRAPVSSS